MKASARILKARTLESSGTWDSRTVDSSRWRIGQGPDRIGSGLLEVRLTESLEHIESRFGVPVPSQGRHREAVKVLARWNEARDPIDLSDIEELDRIAASHRLAWETFLITVAAIEDRRNPTTPFTTDRFKSLLGGHLIDEGRDGSPRNTQFELFVAAHFRLASCTVHFGEPDLRLLYGGELVGVAVKRVRSLNPDQVQKHARKAAQQIEATGSRGWIAMNLDSRFADVDYDQPEMDLLKDFEDKFDAVGAALQRTTMKPHVLGFLLFGHVHSWRPPEGGTTAPRLHSAPPLRWFRLVDDAADVALFETFSGALADRMATRSKLLASKNFTGLL